MLPLQSFKQFIVQNHLFTADQKVLLAVSGGKDSVLMVHLFKLAGFNFGIAHCNFNLRGEESIRDENFVKMLAATVGCPFYVVHFNTRAYAKTHKLSTQMAARTLRYNWFEEIRVAESYDCVAVAHHQNDAIETLLLNLTRGTGLSGLHGILPKRENLVRPLLFLSIAEIKRLVADNNISYIEDSSNLSDYYARNKIRLHVIPQLKAINPNLEQTFTQNIQRFSEAERLIRQVVENYRRKLLVETGQGLTIKIEALKTLEPQNFLLYELLKPYNFTAALVQEVLNALDKQTGTSFYSTTHRITLNRDVLLISPLNTANRTNSRLIHPSDLQIDFKDQEISIRHTDSLNFEKSRDKAYTDSDLLQYPLLLRSWQQGDTFVPLGMQQHKKISDFFIDQKIPLPEKENVPVLVNGNGEVIWIAGLRPDNRYKVTAGTKKVVIFELKFK